MLHFETSQMIFLFINSLKGDKPLGPEDQIEGVYILNHLNIWYFLLDMKLICLGLTLLPFTVALSMVSAC